MADAKHTPGPWSFDGEYVWADAIKGYVANPSTEDMLSGDAVPHREKFAVIAANGRLIAAAPELLEALDILLANLSSDLECEGHDPADDARVKLARAAIAKATSPDQPRGLLPEVGAV